MKSTKANNKIMDVCSMLFDQIPEPKGLEMCKAVNVYDNKYRINVYTRSRCPIHDVDKIRITQSYFARVDGGKLHIVSPKI